NRSAWDAGLERLHVVRVPGHHSRAPVVLLLKRCARGTSKPLARIGLASGTFGAPKLLRLRASSYKRASGACRACRNSASGARREFAREAQLRRSIARPT